MREQLIIILSKIFTFISVSNIEIKWLENLDKTKSYLIVANHPAFVDWFLIRDLFLSQDIDIKWIMHNWILDTKFLWDYLKSSEHIWVLSKKKYRILFKKMIFFKKAEKKYKSRFLKSNEILESKWNLFIFITWAIFKFRR